MEGLLENKREYVEHLCDLLGDSFVRELQRVYDTSLRALPVGATDSLQAFQHAMVVIPKWNVDVVKELRERVESASECAYLGKLVKAVFTVSMQVYLLQAGRTKDKVKVRVPTLDVFLHHCLVEFARIIWKRPYLFYHAVRSLERQKNWALCERLSRKAIVMTLRKSLPMDDIVDRVTMMEPGDAEVAKSSDEESSASSSSGDSSDSESEEPETELAQNSESESDTEEPEPSHVSQQEEPEAHESESEPDEPEPELASEPDEPELEPELEREREPEREPKLALEYEPSEDTDEQEPLRKDEHESSASSSRSGSEAEVHNEPIAEVRQIMIQQPKVKKANKPKHKPYDAFF